MVRPVPAHRVLAAGFAAAALAAAVASPAAALNLTAPLVPLHTGASCVRDPAAAGGSCPHLAAGLLGAAGLAVETGGRRVAVAAADADAVAQLRRSPSGSLVGGACVQAPGGGPCSAHAAGLHGVDAVVAVGGGLVDAGARDDHAVVELAGTAERACVSATALHGCAGRAPSLGAVVALAADPSGQNVYAVSFGPSPGTDTVTTLRRAHGRLTAVSGAGGCIQSAGPSTARCAARAPGLEGADAAAVSPDGRFVYVASRLGSAVVVLRRDRSTGRLSPQGCLGDRVRVGAGDVPCGRRISGLQGADAVAVSPDGRVVYVASADPGAVLAVRRNRGSGRLSTVLGCLGALPLPLCGTLPDVRGARALVLDGRELDVAADAADAVVALPLAPVTGAFLLPGPAAPATAALNAPASLAAAGGDLYAASPYDDGVIALTR
jgi:DNA-binding beta-propeller fold protein YncE